MGTRTDIHLKMGANQSTRKITVVNDEVSGVIKISDAVVQRLKGEITGEADVQEAKPTPPPPPPVEVAPPPPVVVAPPPPVEVAPPPPVVVAPPPPVVVAPPAPPPEVLVAPLPVAEP